MHEHDGMICRACGREERASEGEAVTWMRLRVRDDGVGMSPETLEHAFEPFFTTKDAGRGTGIGLATVHDVITGAGGFVRVASRVGEGTTFTIYLPAADAPPAPSDPISSDVPRGTERLVVVEDQPALRALTTEQLTDRLTDLGLKLEAIHSAAEGISGPLVVGRVLTVEPEPQKNGKTINWCTVDVGDANGTGEPQGIVCGAHNFAPGDLVVVVLPGGVLPERGDSRERCRGGRMIAHVAA